MTIHLAAAGDDDGAPFNVTFDLALPDSDCPSTDTGTKTTETTPTETGKSSNGGPPSATAEKVLVLPKTRKCGSRKLILNAVNPAEDRLTAVKISLNGKQVVNATGGKVKPEITIGRIPQDAFKVKVTGTTATGKTFTRTVTYKSCKKRKTGQTKKKGG